MFRHSSSSCPSSAPSYGDALMQHAAASFSAALAVAVPAQIPRGGGGGYLDGNSSVGAFSPPSACYSSSLPSSYYNSIQRSISSHSLPLHVQLAGDPLGGGGGGNGFFSPSSPSPHQLPLPPLSSSPSSSSGDLFEFTSSCPVRRVFSTGDLQVPPRAPQDRPWPTSTHNSELHGIERDTELCCAVLAMKQGMNGSSPPRPAPSAADGCAQDGGGPFSQKVGRYSAEERKERIERYRVKRNQRNFNKKITYACRKTLADSRPRVKGRFARNGEADAEADEREASDNSYGEHCCGELGNGGGSGCYDDGPYKMDALAVSTGAVVVSAFNGGGGGDNGEWWWRAPGAAAAEEAPRQRQQQPQQVGFDDDDELWATLGDMLSVNPASA
ncbi:hypothetical protein ACP4OV_019745 [Aristida adscensionis]